MLSGAKILRKAHSVTDTRVPINTLLMVISIKLSTVHVDRNKAPEKKEADPVGSNCSNNGVEWILVEYDYFKRCWPARPAPAGFFQ